MSVTTIAQFGLGPIGAACVELAASRPRLRIVGAVDIDPRKAGKTVRELTGVELPDDVRVFASFDELYRHVQPQVVLHTAGSSAQASIEQILPMARQGVSVASSCEELVFPALRAPEAAQSLDEAASRCGARVVGTGVNPGFVMDVLPVCLTAVSRRVERIWARRVVNASRRRMPLQKKIGSGMAPEDFRALFRQGKAGHAGFRESTSLIAHAMGWRLDAIEETCEPVVAEHGIKTQYFEVSRGQVRGLHQRCLGRMDGAVKVELDLTMALEADDEHDAVKIEGEPPLDVLVRGGVAGDQATVAALVNIVPRLLMARPGLRLLTELALPSWGGEA